MTIKVNRTSDTPEIKILKEICIRDLDSNVLYKVLRGYNMSYFPDYMYKTQGVVLFLGIQGSLILRTLDRVKDTKLDVIVANKEEYLTIKIGNFLK